MVAILAGGFGAAYWWSAHQSRLPVGIVFDNGRIEADEIDIETKFAGRIAEMLVDEGDMEDSRVPPSLSDAAYELRVPTAGVDNAAVIQGDGLAMPIRPKLRPLYPPHWRELSSHVRFERADGRCQRCGRPDLVLLRCLPDGRWFDEQAATWRDRRGRPGRWPDLMEAPRFRMTRVVLAAAHLDSDPTNNRLVPAPARHEEASAHMHKITVCCPRRSFQI